MAPKKRLNNNEEDIMDRIEALEKSVENRIKNLENKMKGKYDEKIEEMKEKYNEKVEEIKRKYDNKLEETEKKNEERARKAKEKIEEEIEKLKQRWEEIYKKKTEDNEIRYQRYMDEMEERYLNTFRNLDETRQTQLREENCRPQRQTTDITKPTFYGNRRDQHPRDFINELREYFAIKQIYDEEKLIVVKDCLKSTAGSWFLAIRFQLRNYEEFERVFIDEYWSKEIQIQVWSQCLNVTQIAADIKYREHFMYWATNLRHLEMPYLSEGEIVQNIAGHYPGYLRAILTSLPQKTILNAMKVLGAEEHRRRVPARDNNPRNNNDNNPRHNNSYNRPNNTNQQYGRWRENQNGNTQNTENNRNFNQPGQNSNQWRDQQQVRQITVEENEGEESVEEITHTINNIPTNKKTISPYLQCNIEGESVNLLIDTGATVSVLAKEVVDRILKKNPSVPTLPVSGVQISNAIGKKLCKVSKQIYCSCELNEADILVTFVQMENLNERGIIGTDVLDKYDAQIDFQNKTIRWRINKTEHITPFREQETSEPGDSTTLQQVEIARERISDRKLLPEEMVIFNELLWKYEHIFSENPGKIADHECQINVIPGEPIYQKPYPIPISKLEKMDKEVARMLHLGIIEPSDSPWSSPIVGVEKRNGEVRLCLDARKINTRIVPDRERPTNIDEILMKFQGARYLSSIDLTAGYWQCRLKKECRGITAFLYRGRNYQFKVLPFGLINSVAEFQKILDKVLGSEVLQFTAVYVDDIHVTSPTFSEHMNRLEKIFHRFQQYNVTINMKKSQFLCSQIIFLGHIISEKGLIMDPDKIKAIQNFQEPKSKKQVQSFLGFINFYRQYIRDLSKYTTVLSQLTKKNTEWEWNEEQRKAFQTIKEQFLDDIVLEYPDFTREFYLATDASKTHLGAELYQLDEEGRHRTLGFASRKLQGAEQNYYTTELELLAIVFGCTKYRNYILGYRVNVTTDHKALTFLNQCQLLNARLMRWAIKLQEFDLQITHVPGKDNIGADTLTRYPQIPGDGDEIQKTTIYINKVIYNQYSTKLLRQFEQMKDLQDQDEELNTIRDRIKSHETHRYKIHQGLLFFIDKNGREKLMLPKIMVQDIVVETHELFGHFGAAKIHDMLRREYQIHKMYHTIKQIIKRCDLCQRSKIPNQNTRGPLMANIPEKPKERISLDLMGPLPKGQFGNQYILVLLDLFTKHVQIYAMRKATAGNILRKLRDKYLPAFGPVQSILTDNGTQFHSKAWEKQMKLWKIRHIVTTTYHPEGNPVERTNREIGRILRTFCYQKHTAWVGHLPSIEYWLNNVTHSSTGYTPQELVDGRRHSFRLNKLIPADELLLDDEKNTFVQLAYKRLKKTAQYRCEYHNKGKKFPNYVQGQQVLLREHKLSSLEDNTIKKFFLLYRGPYLITEVRKNNTVVVISENGQQSTHNVKNIKLYVPPDPGKEIQNYNN